MASSDNVTITLHGKGGHGAMPHVAADPVVAGSAIVMGLQSIVARNIDPQQMAIITVGAFNAGVANNVIPQTATLRLSVRSLDRDVRILLEKRITELVHAQAQSYGVTAEIDYQRGYPVLVNHLAETDFARDVAEELVGADKVVRQGRALTAAKTLPSCSKRCLAAICSSAMAMARATATAPAWCTTRATTSTTRTWPWARPIGHCWWSAFCPLALVLTGLISAWWMQPLMAATFEFLKFTLSPLAAFLR
jgi:amidohydrolase